MKRASAVVLDVRTATEFATEHLPGSIWMDVQKDDFATELQKLNKNKTYLVYCRSGRRSVKAIQIMADAGFHKIYHLKGGFMNWKMKKLNFSMLNAVHFTSKGI